jgi:YidC/Oxa1 family membrane protein insertase
MDFQRLILFGALGMVLLLLWQAWLEHDSSKNNANFNSNTSMSAASGTAQNGAYGTKVEADDVPQAPTASAAPESADTPSAIPVNQSLPGERRITVETDLVRVEIDTQGGDLRSLGLLTYPVSLDQPDSPFMLLNDSGADLFLIQDGLLSAGQQAPNHHTVFFYRSPERHTLPR